MNETAYRCLWWLGLVFAIIALLFNGTMAVWYAAGSVKTWDVLFHTVLGMINLWCSWLIWRNRPAELAKANHETV